MGVGSRSDFVNSLAARDLPDNPPEGFRPIDTREGFHTMMGQFYGRMEQVFRNHLVRLRAEDRDG